MTAAERLGAAENWDEDFDFRRAKRPIADSVSAAENWDDDFEDQTTDPHSPPRPRKRQQQQSPFRPSISTAENWDDDFEARSQNSPHTQRGSTSKSTTTENWDEEFKDVNPVVENWDDEFDGAQSSDDDYGAEREEDRTVTVRSRRVVSPNISPPPPVPLMPDYLNLRESLHFPGSPSTSIFSLPTTVGTNRPESSAGYSYTSTMGLRSTLSSGRFAGLPESPPTHRERRRLRKKSRPPHLDGTVMELDDRLPDSPTSPSRPSTPELMVVQGAEELISQTPSNANASMPSTKTPLLSRIGSVKKWRSGRKRLSTETQEVQDESSPRRPRRSIDIDIEVTPRPPNVLAKVQSNPSDQKDNSDSIRFRSSKSTDKTGELRSEKSKDRIFIGLGPSPAKNRWKKYSSRESSPSPSPANGSYRRPSSLMIHASGGSGKSRQVSSSSVVFGVNKSVAGSRASFSASVEDLTHRLVKSVSRDRSIVDESEEGRRGFIGGIRRISFGNSEGRNEDASGDDDSVKKKPKERHNDRWHKKSRGSLSGLDIGNESLVADRPPQIPDLPSFPLTPIFSLLQDPPPESSELLPAAEVEPNLSVSSSEPLRPKLKLEIIKPLPIHLNSPQHSASLGRSALPPKHNDSATVLVQPGGKAARRNSLSDLKIPVRISRAQTGLKRDLGMVKEFASHVEQLKELQYTYNSLVLEVQTVLNNTRTRPSTPAPPSRPTSPTKIFHSRKRSHSSASAMPRSTIVNQMSNALKEIENKYSTAWECAELLIELGGGAASISKAPSRASLASNPLPVSNSAPPEMMIRTKSRERAITLAGDEHSPSLPTVGLPPVTKSSRNSAEWRAPTGRHDLSQRQLVLLREMLSRSEAMASEDVHVHPLGSLQVPESETVNREWSWGADPGGSTITLPPSENSSVRDGDRSRSPTKKRRNSRLGMSAVRDMLRNLKRSVTEQAYGLHPSSGSSVAASDKGNGRRRAKTSTGPESTKSLRDRASPFLSFDCNPSSPYGISTSMRTKSPRRPSLASIFKFSKSHKPNAKSGISTGQSIDNFKTSSSGGTGSIHVTTDHEDEEDWDRVDDSASDLDFHSPKQTPPDGSGTLRVPKVKGKTTDVSSPYLHHEGLPPQPSKHEGLGPDASRSSIWEGTWSRGTKLSNVEETAENLTPSKAPFKQPHSPVPPPPVFGVSPRPPSRSRTLSPRVPSVKNGGKSAFVGSESPQWLDYVIGQVPDQFQQQQQPLPDPKLAMKPEDIKPLLENARAVQMRCGESVSEMRLLVSLGALGEETTLRT